MAKKKKTVEAAEPAEKPKKKKKKRAAFLPSLAYLNPAFAAAAVMEVFRYNQKYAEEIQKIPASADLWATHSALRADVFKRTCEAWCRITKKSFTSFPYSEDGVAKLYMRYRKRNQSELAKWEAELQEAVTRAAAKS